MEQSKWPHSIKLIGALVILAIIGWIVFAIYQSSHFRVTGTDPQLKDVTIWSPEMEVNFNKKLSSSGISISTNPQILYSKQFKVSGSKLEIELSVPLNSKQTYTVTINKITDSSGQTITNKQFSFTPKQASRSDLSDEEQEVLIARNQKSPVYNDPILPHLPHNAVDFVLTGAVGATSNNEPALTLEARLQLHQAQMGDPSSAIQQDKLEVQDYITSLGLNPANYKIVYSVSTP